VNHAKAILESVKNKKSWKEIYGDRLATNANGENSAATMFAVQYALVELSKTPKFASLAGLIKADFIDGFI